MLPESIQLGGDPGNLVEAFLAGRTYSHVAVLLDENTRKYCYPLIEKNLPPHSVINVPAGEDFKNLDTCSVIWRRLTELAFDRHSLVLVVGGGVLGDMGGFCAATFKRGVDFVLLPTTLLSQVDASVGGKLGIDFDGYKNQLGVFQEPRATLIAPAFLATLPFRELRSGFAEICKHCIISDAAKWNEIRLKQLQEQDWEDLIQHSVSFKAGVVHRDPREKGERKILNYGHTAGHAIESHFLATANRLFHGEAIAAGMVVEACLAERKGLLRAEERQQIQDYLLLLFGKVELPAASELIRLMKQDKKNKGTTILMAVPKGIGSAVWDVASTEEEVEEALRMYDSI